MKKKIISLLRHLTWNIKSEMATKDIYEKYKAFTMIPPEDYYNNLQLCKRYNYLTGDIIECGTWKGGMIAGIAEIMGSKDRNYYLFDSFEGLPQAKEIDGVDARKWQENIESPYYFDNCKADMLFAELAMHMAGIANPHIIKGWFKNTLPEFHINKNIAILRLDGDWYESIYICMKYLFPYVVNEGLIIVDDYYVWEGTSKAIHDYLSEVKSTSRIYTLSGGVAYIIKK